MTLLTNALSGAVAAQTALNTTSQNIANVMTEGYTRQGVMLRSAQPSRSGTAAAGDGVSVPSLFRFSDSYKNLQLWQSNSTLGQNSVIQPYLTQLEQVMGDDTASIADGLDKFFNALNAASVEPTSSPLRDSVLNAADALAQRFNSLRQTLSSQQQAVAQQRKDLVAQTNTYTADIANLNQRIAEANATGVNASGLIDERDQKIDKLASLVGVQVVTQPDGSANVSLKGGQPLVVGQQASTLAVNTLPNGSQQMSLTFASETFALGSSPLGGQLGGLDTFEQIQLKPMVQSLQDMASGLATGVNNTLTAGYAMNGSAGKPLFVIDTTSTSSLVTIDHSLQAADLGFSGSATEPGNSDQLQALIALKSQPVSITGLGNVLLGDVYTQLVGKLGMASQANQTATTTAQTVRDQADANWKSTSGVNEDEEAVNLMQYQQMYNANMKVISVANELFDAMLQMVG
ncbi:flagellar hook-associated protein FlgK [Ideonella sp. B7]|uniref:flagellar hook-associated protein FlgK n=1 Tax=Ideonella benzenivorans TaxID=2831643 RepID=UPI001CEC3361|nr:flagellar hook-associated protein FlgK [Ideonella benzenivorans]MCA6217232.1 flagellar hook-associated protein FlgK [Ideonella benzenivorans]